MQWLNRVSTDWGNSRHPLFGDGVICVASGFPIAWPLYWAVHIG